MTRAPEAVQRRDVVARNGTIRLHGSAWFPRAEPRGGVLMIPGSGPADRHNDVVFPPLRAHLVERGFAVASFDNRGVGRSGGDWRQVGIDVLAEDARAGLDALRDLEGVPGRAVGLLGHSQGGWVGIETAAADGPGAPEANARRPPFGHHRQGFPGADSPSA